MYCRQCTLPSPNRSMNASVPPISIHLEISIRGEYLQNLLKFVIMLCQFIRQLCTNPALIFSSSILLNQKIKIQAKFAFITVFYKAVFQRYQSNRAIFSKNIKMKHSFSQLNQNHRYMHFSPEKKSNEQRNKYKYEYVFSNENHNQNNKGNSKIRLKTQTNDYRKLEIPVKQSAHQKQAYHSKSISSYHGNSVHSQDRKGPINSHQNLKKSHIQDFQRNVKKNTYTQRTHSYNKSVSTNYQPDIKKSKAQHNPSDIHKAESQILQSQKVLSNQKFQIEALTEELTFYLKTCQSNKKEIQMQNSKKQAMSKQYEQKMRLLISEKDHLGEILDNISRQRQQKTSFQQNEINMKRQINQQIGKNIQRLLNQKQTLLIKIRQTETDTKYLQDEILVKQQQKLDELRNIQRKFNIALKQLQRLQRKKINR